MHFSDVQQQVYRTRRQEANRYFVANKVELGLDICCELDKEPDLCDLLRALIDVDVIMYTAFPNPDKLKLIDHYHALVARVEQTMGADNENLKWLKEYFEQVRRHFDQSRGSPELGGEASVNSHDDISCGEDEKDEKGETGERASDGTGEEETDDSGDAEMDDSEDEETDVTDDNETDDAGDEDVNDVGAEEKSVAEATDDSDDSDPWEGFDD